MRGIDRISLFALACAVLPACQTLGGAGAGIEMTQSIGTLMQGGMRTASAVGQVASAKSSGGTAAPSDHKLAFDCSDPDVDCDIQPAPNAVPAPVVIGGIVVSKDDDERDESESTTSQCSQSCGEPVTEVSCPAGQQPRCICEPDPAATCEAPTGTARADR